MRVMSCMPPVDSLESLLPLINALGKSKPTTCSLLKQLRVAQSARMRAVMKLRCVGSEVPAKVSPYVCAGCCEPSPAMRTRTLDGSIGSGLFLIAKRSRMNSAVRSCCCGVMSLKHLYFSNTLWNSAFIPRCSAAGLMLFFIALRRLNTLDCMSDGIGRSVVGELV